jgi:hypothetical protein
MLRALLRVAGEQSLACDALWGQIQLCLDAKAQLNAGTARDFLPGHDQRAIHERIAKVGAVKDLITWFDDTWTEPASLEPAR